MEPPCTILGPLYHFNLSSVVETLRLPEGWGPLIPFLFFSLNPSPITGPLRPELGAEMVGVRTRSKICKSWVCGMLQASRQHPHPPRGSPNTHGGQLLPWGAEGTAQREPWPERGRGLNHFNPNTPPWVWPWWWAQGTGLGDRQNILETSSTHNRLKTGSGCAHVVRAEPTHCRWNQPSPATLSLLPHPAHTWLGRKGRNSADSPLQYPASLSPTPTHQPTKPT